MSTRSVKEHMKTGPALVGSLARRAHSISMLAQPNGVQLTTLKDTAEAQDAQG